MDPHQPFGLTPGDYDETPTSSDFPSSNFLNPYSREYRLDLMNFPQTQPSLYHPERERDRERERIPFPSTERERERFLQPPPPPPEWSPTPLRNPPTLQRYPPPPLPMYFPERSYYELIAEIRYNHDCIYKCLGDVSTCPHHLRTSVDYTELIHRIQFHNSRLQYLYPFLYRHSFPHLSHS
jgi:hypothetical protein